MKELFFYTNFFLMLEIAWNAKKTHHPPDFFFFTPIFFLMLEIAWNAKKTWNIEKNKNFIFFNI